MKRKLFSKFLGSACLNPTLSTDAISSFGSSASYYRINRGGGYERSRRQYLVDTGPPPVMSSTIQRKVEVAGDDPVISDQVFNFRKGRRVKELLIVDGDVRNKSLFLKMMYTMKKLANFDASVVRQMSCLMSQLKNVLHIHDLVKRGVIFVAIILATVGSNKMFAQTTLTDGDIAFTRVNGDDPDSFSFVCLTDISSSTEIYFTNEYWDGSSLTAIYFTYLFTATSAISAGEEVHIDVDANSISSTSGSVTATFVSQYTGDAVNFIHAGGDNIMAFQGSIASPTFIAAISTQTGVIGTSGNAWQTSFSVNNTILPAGKTNGQDGYLGMFPNGATQTEVDNVRYKTTALHSGDKATVLAAIMDLSNWEFDNSITFPASSTVFSVSGSNTAPTFTSLAGVVESTNEDTGVDITFAEIAAQGNETDVDGTVDAFVVKAVSSGTLTINGSAYAATTNDEITAAKSAFWTPATNANGTLNAFTITAKDDAGDESTTSAVQATVSVTAVNDDPTLTGLPASITVTEDVASNVDLSSAIFADVDAGSNNVSLIITAAAGTLSANNGGGVTISNSGTSAITLFGTVANIDTYLNTASNIQYTTTSNSTTSTNFTFTANDGGNTGTGGGTTISVGSSVTVNITAVNDDPTLTGLPASITVTEDVASNVDLSSATFADVDAGSGSVSLMITAAAGTLSASSGGGVTISNSGSSAITLSGTASNIDTYLNTASNIKYTNASNSAASTSLSFTANDGGNTGTGGGTIVSVGASVTVNIIDVTPPVSPVVTSPSGSAIVNSATQMLSGTHTENGVTVHAYADNNNDGVADNSTSLGSSTVSGNSWSFSVSLTADAANNFVVQAEDAAGNISSYVDIPTITEDSTDPVSPVVTSPSGSVTVNSATQMLSGTHAENGVTVHAYADSNNDGVADNTTSLGSSTVSGNSWSFSVSLTADAANNFVVQAEDAAGNVSSDVDVPTITEDSSDPILNSSNPTDDATAILVGNNLTLTFSEAITFGNGTIEIIDLDNGSSTITIDVTSPGTQASISGDVLTLNPSSDLEYSTNYAVQIEATAIKDLYSNAYSGIVDNTTLNFYTEEDLVTTSSLSPNGDDTKLMIYPNPASDYVFISIDVEVEEVLLIDLQAKTLKPDILKVDQKWRIDIGDFPAGIYQLLIRSKKGLIVEKLLIQ